MKKDQKQSASSWIFGIIIPVIMVILLALCLGVRTNVMIKSPLILFISSLYLLIFILYTDYCNYLARPNIINFRIFEVDKNKDKLSFYFLWIFHVCIYFFLLYFIFTSLISLF